MFVLRVMSSCLWLLQKLKLGKQLKHKACQLFVDHLKSHYQENKFKSPVRIAHSVLSAIHTTHTHTLMQDDYKSLIRTLCHNYFKTLNSKEPPTTNEMNSDIAAIVERVMSQVDIYSPSKNTELGLCSSYEDVL